MQRNEFELEVCANSVQSAIAADQAGADRVELCDNLYEGGTSPSAGMFYLTKEHTSLDVYPIIRPRGGDFLYSEEEFTVMLKDIKHFRQAGADGFVFGCLTAAGKVDYEKCSRLIEATKGLPVTFHRAFDMTEDALESLGVLKILGVSRVLTSGQKNKAIDGVPLIAKLVKAAGKEIIIMAGSGIDENNIAHIAKQSEARAFHVSLRNAVESKMIFRRTEINMGGSGDIPEFTHKFTNPERVKKCLEVLEGL